MSPSALITSSVLFSTVVSPVWYLFRVLCSGSFVVAGYFWPVPFYTSCLSIFAGKWHRWIWKHWQVVWIWLGETATDMCIMHNQIWPRNLSDEIS